MKTFLSVLGYFWASPITVIGLIYAAFCQACSWYKFIGVYGDALVWKVNEEKIPGWLGRLYWNRWAGHAIGNVVVVKFDVDSEHGLVILKHEQEHVHQGMVFGPFMPFLYGLNSLCILCCRNAHPYYDNSFEIDARRAAGQTIDIKPR